jgi:broad specificity phosphatase PhoE
MARTVDLRRHTEAEGDTLTPNGVRAAVEIGSRLGGYDLVISSGAQRATQTIACFLAGMGQKVMGGVVVNTGFRSQDEARWMETARGAEGKDLAAFRKVDPEFVAKEAALLGDALRAVIDAMPDGGRALVVGHSPTTEAAVLGLTGEVVAPIAKGAGVRVLEDGGRYHLQPLD